MSSWVSNLAVVSLDSRCRDMSKGVSASWPRPGTWFIGGKAEDQGREEIRTERTIPAFEQKDVGKSLVHALSLLRYLFSTAAYFYRLPNVYPIAPSLTQLLLPARTSSWGPPLGSARALPC